MIYEVVTLNVTVNGAKYLKGKKLDDSKFPKGLLKACYRDGAMKPEGSKAENPLEVIAEYKQAEKKADKNENNVESNFPEDMPGREALLKSGINTFDELKALDDFTSVNGIGQATSDTLTEWLDNKN